MTMDHIGRILAQPRTQPAYAFRNIERAAAVETHNRHSQRSNRFDPMRRVGEDRDHSARDSFGIEVFEVGVEQSFRTARTKSLDEMNDAQFWRCGPVDFE